MLLEKIPKKRMRSLNGTEGSAASCNTLALNDSQLISLGIVLRFKAILVIKNKSQLKDAL
jgi:hypothetical protein